MSAGNTGKTLLRPMIIVVVVGLALVAILLALKDREDSSPTGPNVSEDLVGELDFFFDDLSIALTNMADDQVRAVFTPKFKGDTLFDSPGAPQAPIQGITESPLPVGSPPHPLADLALFFNGFDRIDRAVLKVASIDRLEHIPDELKCETKWVVRGGTREIIDRCLTHFVLKDNRWWIAGQKRISGRVLEAAAPAFDDVTALAGITIPAGMRCRRMSDEEFSASHERGMTRVPGESCHGCTYDTPYLQLGGVAVGDYDGDGRPDLYVVRPGRNILLRNLDGTRFEDVTDAAGVGHPGFGAGALWFDADGDADLDLVATSLCCRGTRSCHGGALMLFRNAGDGTFRSESLHRHGAAFSVCAADFDGDSDLDLYVAFYGGTKQQTDRFTYGPGTTSYLDSRNGEPNALLWNDGNGAFVDSGEAADTRWSLACVATDLNDDGRPDLYVANDFGRNTLYLNKDGRSFVDATEVSGVGDSGFGMGVTMFDGDGDAQLDLYISNMYSTAGGRVLEQSGAELPPALRDRMEKARSGSSLLRQLGKGRFEDRGKEAGVHRAGWAWGSAAIDTFHRGLQDLYVANGFMSGLGAADL
jgi:hypothetical protein